MSLNLSPVLEDSNLESKLKLLGHISLANGRAVWEAGNEWASYQLHFTSHISFEKHRLHPRKWSFWLYYLSDLVTDGVIPVQQGRISGSLDNVAMSVWCQAIPIKSETFTLVVLLQTFVSSLYCRNNSIQLQFRKRFFSRNNAFLWACIWYLH